MYYRNTRKQNHKNTRPHVRWCQDSGNGVYVIASKRVPDTRSNRRREKEKECKATLTLMDISETTSEDGGQRTIVCGRPGEQRTSKGWTTKVERMDDEG